MRILQFEFNLKNKLMAEKPNTAAKKLSDKSTKQEMLDAYQSVVKQLDEKRAVELAPERRIEEKRTEEAIKVAATVAPESIDRDIGNLKGEIGKLLANVSDMLATESAKFRNIQKAVESKERDLQELYGIEKTAVSLASLIEAQNRKRSDFETEMSNDRETLETQLKKLDTDCIDFYHFHGIGNSFFTHERREEAVNGALKAKEEGLIRHLSFSFHDKPEVMLKLIDLGIFSSVLCQYNLLDRANEEVLAQAKARGLGTVIMGPVGGGRISGMPPQVAQRFGVNVKSNAELALRFVMTNPNVDITLSGMSTLAQVEENAAIASNATPLSAEELQGIAAALEENRRMADLYCTGCNYCAPHCPQQIVIPRIFELMNYHRVYGITDYAREQYDGIGGPWQKGSKADVCIECGVCEDYCPQKIEIRKQLKECHKTLAAATSA